MGLPKIHKKNIPLGPIVLSQGSVTYGVAKELARILKPLTGNIIHQVNNSKEFAEDIKKIKLEEGECIISYDVAALFTSIPSEVYIRSYKEEVGTGYRAQPENYHVHSKHIEPAGVLVVQHLFPVPRSIL